jgi:hypothetical protein
MTARNPQPEERQPAQESSRINPIAVIAGALASLSAAVVASYFGVAGTLIGTAVVSIVSSLTAALYAGLLGRTRGALQHSTTVLRVVSSRAGGPRRPTRPGAAGPASAEEGTGPAGAAGPGEAGGPATPDARLQRLAELGAEVEGRTAARPHAAGPAEAAASADRPHAAGRGAWPWGRSVVVVGMAVLIFAIAIGAVTGIEAAIKEPIATALGVRDRGQARTSVGVAVSRAGGSGTSSRSTPTSSTQPTPSSGPQGQAPSTTEPAPSTTTGGAAPSSTAPPTTTTPGPSTTAGTSSSR